MKTNLTSLKTIVLIGIILSLTAPLSLFAQPDYVFRNPVLLSGTNLKVGAKYRFPNVKTGIDGIIEIKDLKNGVTLTQLDGGSGFDAAFQPAVTAPGKSNGYVEFQLDFVVSGTFTNVKMPELPMTAIDIDGGIHASGRVYEYDQFEHGSEFRTMYEMLGSSLTVTNNSGWSTVRNATGVDYPGIDTVQKDVMFTAVYNNVDKVLFRVGADNQTNGSVNRLRSIYFKKFNYASGLLPVGSLVHFGGFSDKTGVQLNWELAAGCRPGTITIERSTDATKFAAVAYRTVTSSNYAQKDGFFDGMDLQGTIYYRLKLQTQSGETEYTRILMVKSQGTARQNMRIYPTIVEGNTTLNFHAPQRSDAVISVVDMNGRSLTQQKFSAGEGANTVQLDGLEKLTAGVYMVSVAVGQERMTQRIVKR
ncbi:MAG: T9SS type A sorting domain-containing protein [Chitinophagaceae bacterium]|nr:T9SS type A sorting domain-containing protein [Chitinophagaceae bacterium]